MTLPSQSNAPEVADRLAEIVGARHVLSRASELLVYNSDGLPGYRRQPRLAVFPGTRVEAIAVVRFLAEQGLPFVPRGAGTGLSGGALADDIIVISTSSIVARRSSPAS
jgi:glycolate oxidase